MSRFWRSLPDGVAVAVKVQPKSRRPGLQGAALLDRASQTFIPWYREHMLDATRPYPGTHEMLERLEAASISMAIATNKSDVRLNVSY